MLLFTYIWYKYNEENFQPTNESWEYLTIEKEDLMGLLAFGITIGRAVATAAGVSVATWIGKIAFDKRWAENTSKQVEAKLKRIQVKHDKTEDKEQKKKIATDIARLKKKLVELKKAEEKELAGEARNRIDKLAKEYESINEKYGSKITKAEAKKLATAMAKN